MSLRLGGLLYDIRGGLEEKGHAQWFDAWLDENQIPREAAYRVMEVYTNEMDSRGEALDAGYANAIAAKLAVSFADAYQLIAFHVLSSVLVEMASRSEAGGKLPVVIVFVDTDEHVNRVLPLEMAAHRLIVRENVVIEQGSLD